MLRLCILLLCLTFVCFGYCMLFYWLASLFWWFECYICLLIVWFYWIGLIALVMFIVWFWCLCWCLNDAVGVVFDLIACLLIYFGLDGWLLGIWCLICLFWLGVWVDHCCVLIVCFVAGFCCRLEWLLGNSVDLSFMWLYLSFYLYNCICCFDCVCLFSCVIWLI